MKSAHISFIAVRDPCRLFEQLDEYSAHTSLKPSAVLCAFNFILVHASAARSKSFTAKLYDVMGDRIGLLLRDRGLSCIC